MTRSQLWTVLFSKGDIQLHIFSRTVPRTDIIPPQRVFRISHYLVAMNPGVYSGLNTNSQEVRVLKLLPGGWSDVIQCQMSRVLLEENPDYEALSYVWGDSLLKYKILVNGVLYPITTNLYLALRRLRCVDAARTIWVDAVCINQADTEEKTRQVSIRGEIYKSQERFDLAR